MNIRDTSPLQYPSSVFVPAYMLRGKDLAPPVVELWIFHLEDLVSSYQDDGVPEEWWLTLGNHFPFALS